MPFGIVYMYIAHLTKFANTCRSPMCLVSSGKSLDRGKETNKAREERKDPFLSRKENKLKHLSESHKGT